MQAFLTKRGDTKPIKATLERKQLDGTYAAIDLQTATAVRFKLRDSQRREVIDALAQIEDPALGHVQYKFLPGQTATAGAYDAEWEITWFDNSIETVPSNGYVPVVIEEDVG